MLISGAWKQDSTSHIVDVKLHRMRAALGPRPERRAGARDMVRRKVEQQLFYLIAEVVLEEMPRPRHAVGKVLWKTIDENSFHRLHVVHLHSMFNHTV